MPVPALLKLLLTVGVFTVLLAGCFKAPSPEVGLRELRAQAEERLLQDAKLAFLQADYPEAVLLLNRFVKTHPKSIWMSEAQWWLARSYEESGNLRLALGRFQRLAQLGRKHPYQHESQLRAESLIKTLGIEALPSKTRGISVGLLDLRGSGEIASLMAQHQNVKGAVLLINLGCPLPKHPGEMSEGLMNESSDEGIRLGRGLGPLIDDAHQAGQAVYLGVSLPCLGLFAKGSGEEMPQWHDWSFEEQTQQVRKSPYFSLFSSEYQTAVIDMLSKLSRFNIAGMVFQEEVPLGPREGLSPIAIQKFEAAFDDTLNPISVFRRGQPVRTSQHSPEEVQQLLMEHYPDVFWKWSGWKARERLRVMKAFVRSIRGQFPHLQFGLEIHPESLYAPVYALATFSEDWVETAHVPFDFFVTRISDSFGPGIHSDLPGGFQPDTRAFHQSLIQQMVDYLEDPQRVWVMVERQDSRTGPSSVRADMEKARWEWPEGVGEILDVSTLP